LSSSQEFVFEGTPDSARDQQNESVEKIINSLSAETAKRYAAYLLSLRWPPSCSGCSARGS
jgi:hypothetical protein